MSGAGGLRYCATERSRDGDTYVYDIALRDAGGEVVERWEGLRLRAVRKTGRPGPVGRAAARRRTWSVRVGDLLGARGRRHGGARRLAAPDEDADRGAARPDGGRRRPRPRPPGRDRLPPGRPAGGRRVTGASPRAHGAGLTLARRRRPARSGCDVEPVAHRSEAGLAGPARRRTPRLAALLAAERRRGLRHRRDPGLDARSSACRRPGCAPGAPLTLLTAPRPRLGRASPPATCGSPRSPTTLRDVAEPVVFAMLTEGRD